MGLLNSFSIPPVTKEPVLTFLARSVKLERVDPREMAKRILHMA